MIRMERVTHREEILVVGETALSALHEALSSCRTLLPGIKELAEYYCKSPPERASGEDAGAFGMGVFILPFSAVEDRSALW